MMKLLATICIATYAAALNLKQHTCELAQIHDDNGEDEMVCTHFCKGDTCGWDCKKGGATVADCNVTLSPYGGNDCDVYCMANGQNPFG